MIDKLKMYPITQMKDGKEELVSIQFVYVDDTGTAVNSFSISDINGNNKDCTYYPSLKVTLLLLFSYSLKSNLIYEQVELPTSN